MNESDKKIAIVKKILQVLVEGNLTIAEDEQILLEARRQLRNSKFTF